MPTYEYGCNSCGFSEEIIRTMSEMEEVKKSLPLDCPECGASKSYSMIFSVPNFRMGKKGYHSTKQGMRRKAEQTRKNERLGDTQWENHEPLKVSDPTKVVNPTEGGVFDPNSRRFVGRKS